MSEECNDNCAACDVECTERTEPENDFSVKLHELSSVKKVIGVVSGKGGVGKSLITSMLAVHMAKEGYKTAILDADVTGPSIPKAFGLTSKALNNEIGLLPVKSRTGIDIMSLNLLLENDTDPVVWRGPIIAGAVKQFWSDVIWENIDYMFIDMPPGTGDVPLTVFQSIPVDGIIIVTSPQELVSMIVSKAVKMAQMMDIPILGIVENMSYLTCPDCDEKINLFGESNVEEVAKDHDISVFAKLPIDPNIARACDEGKIEEIQDSYLSKIADALQAKEDHEFKVAVASEGEMVTAHFGHCENFNIYTVKGKEIIKTESIGNPGHKPGFLPNFLNDMGVNVIISGGMGGGAVDIFNEKGIQVVIGPEGDSKTAVEKYLNNELESTGSACDH